MGVVPSLVGLMTSAPSLPEVSIVVEMLGSLCADINKPNKDGVSSTYIAA